VSTVPVPRRAAAPGADGWLARLGLAEGAPDVRLGLGLVAVVLCVYLAFFLVFYPRVATNEDEAAYLRQAVLLVEQGTSKVSKLDALKGEVVEHAPSRYPIGTALLMAPFVLAFGWKGAFLLAPLSLVAGALLTARWIREQGRSPAFALLLFAFPATLVMGRVAMSDMPSLALVALGLWLFWRGLDGAWGWWLASGLVAGGSLILRESNALPFAVFFAGTVLRRERFWPLLVGGLVGVAGRLAASQWAYGSPFFVKATYYFSPETFMDRLPLYLLGLLVFLPGGLLFGLAYRGRRASELRITVVVFFVFFLLQGWGMTASDLPKRLVIALRYFLPLLPLLVFAMAECVPRLWLAQRERLLRTAPDFERILATALAVSFLGMTGAAGAVHVAYDRWSASRAEIRDLIDRTAPADALLVTNWWATRKFAGELERRYLPVDRSEVTPERALELADRHGGLFVVLLDRSDTAHWREDAGRNQAFVDGLAGRAVLELDRAVSPTDRLRVWRVDADDDGPAPGLPSGHGDGG
jgi:4-amino-4-deoxy-L-arabinose transferase-like glycosyltransferase